MSQIIVQLFEKCLSPNNNLRRQAEKELFEYSTKYFYQTLAESCSIIISNESKKEIRQFGGTFLKYIFTNEIYKGLWGALTKEQIDLIKTSLMGSLASELQDVRQTSSLAIAAMAIIEIPKGWEVVQILYNASLNQNNNFRITSLLTLKNIVEFMGFRLKPENIALILAALVANLDTQLNLEVINQAILGLFSIIPLIENIFQNEKQREYIINSLNNLMDINFINKAGLNTTIENIQKNILMTYIQIMKYFTKYIGKSFSKIANITLRYFTCNNQTLSTLSIEVWCTLCEDELMNKNNKITSNYQDILNDYIIRIIQERDTSSFDTIEDWDSTKAAIILIQFLVLLKNEKVSQRMLSYISECLNNDLLQKSEINFNALTKEEKIKSLIIKQNAFLIYRGLLFSKELDPEIIKSSLDKIIIEIKNPNSYPIIISIGKCLVIICKFHFKIINTSKTLFDQFMQQFLPLMKININNKQLEKYLLLSFQDIIKNTDVEYFNNYLTEIITTLMNIAYAPDSCNKECNLTKLSMYLTCKIIEICEENDDNKKIIHDFFAKIYTLLQESLNIEAFKSIEEQQYIQDGIISIISNCCLFQKIDMNATQIECVYNLINQAIIQRKEPFNDAIFCFGAFSYFGWGLFSNINNQVIDYILMALEDKNNLELCYQGLLAAADIIRNVGEENINNIPKIVEKMQKIIKDTEIPRGLKIQCFLVYNDIFMIQDNSIGGYLGQVMQLIYDGISISVDPPNQEMDNDTLEYLNEFREKIVELLTNVFMYLRNHNQTNVFSQYIDGYIKYLSKIVEPEFNPSLILISETGGLLADFYIHFKASMELHLNKNSLKFILQQLEKNQNINQEYQDNLLYMQKVFAEFIENYF